LPVLSKFFQDNLRNRWTNVLTLVPSQITVFVNKYLIPQFYHFAPKKIIQLSTFLKIGIFVCEPTVNSRSTLIGKGGRGLHKVQFFSPGCKTISNITSILSTPFIISSINNIPTPPLPLHNFPNPFLSITVSFLPSVRCNTDQI
jgi:hypothetical protein